MVVETYAVAVFDVNDNKVVQKRNFPTCPLNVPFFRDDISLKGYGWTPLHYACEYDAVDIAEHLIEKDKMRRAFARQEQQKSGQEGESPIYNLKDRYGRTPIVFSQSTKMAEVLFKNPDLNAHHLLWHFVDMYKVIKSVPDIIRSPHKHMNDMRDITSSLEGGE